MESLDKLYIINYFTYHRNYSDIGGSIGLAIYDNRMEIFNNGGLSPEVTLEKIKSGFSKPSNPLIADVLYRCNLIEKWGRGVPKMISSCKAAHDPEPEFIVDEIEFKVTFMFPTSINPPRVLLGTLDEQQAKLNRRQREIIEMLSNVRELKPKDIIDGLTEPTTDRTLRRDLAGLRALNIIDTQGSGRTVVWFLTGKNKES